MRRDELAHLLRAASRIVPDADMLIIGSQAVHGGIDDSLLPELTVMSREVDVDFFDDPEGSLADAVDGALGELSRSIRPSATTRRASRCRPLFSPRVGVSA